MATPQRHHFDETLFAAIRIGSSALRRLRSDLASDRPPRNEQRLQDRYSLRCAPHVIGVLEDALPWLRANIENELNSANDNPLIDAVQERVLHGGHFYGGHIAFAMDCMKNAVANLADLLDRQMALLVDARYSHGLPPTRAAAARARRSAWMRPADQRICLRPRLASSPCRIGMSRSTSAQPDKVSMARCRARLPRSVSSPSGLRGVLTAHPGQSRCAALARARCS